MSAYCYSCMSKIKDNKATECQVCKRALFLEVPSHHIPAGTVLKNRYILGYSVGEGGFGITYIGYDTILDMKVAIKEFYPTGYVNRTNNISNNVIESTSTDLRDFFEKGKERFLSEARVMARFSGYTGIASVRDFFDDNNTAYLVMEYVEGVTLSDYLKEKGNIPCDEAIRMLTPVMYALKEIHCQNIIHCDINPKNIMICKDGKVKLLDFGAAKGVRRLSNQSTPILLCPGYAPEEQYRTSGTLGPWTDVYSLCAVLYKCITGKTPVESVERLSKDNLVSPLEITDNISIALNNALIKGLALHHEDRFGSIEQLMSALSCPSEPIEEKTVCVFSRETSNSDDSRTIHLFMSPEENESVAEQNDVEPEQESLSLEMNPEQLSDTVSQEVVVKKRTRKPLVVTGCIFLVFVTLVMFLVFGYRITICGESVWGLSTNLVVYQKDVTNADIETLSKMPFLQSVTFYQCGLHSLSSNMALSPEFRVKELSIIQTGGGVDYILDSLPHKESLQSLKINESGDWISGSIKLDFRQFSGLRELELSKTSSINVTNWAEAKQLEVYVGTRYNFSIDYSNLLRKCVKLKKVVLSECNVGNINFIEKLPDLEYISLNSSYVTNVEFLKTYSKATDIEIHTDGIWS